MSRPEWCQGVCVNAPEGGEGLFSKTYNTVCEPCRRRATFSKHPTTGAMLSELDYNGIHLRGHDGITDERLAKLLREKGYDVSPKPAPHDKGDAPR